MKTITHLTFLIICLNLISCSNDETKDYKIKQIGYLTPLFSSSQNFEDYNKDYEIVFDKEDTSKFRSFRDDYFEVMKKNYGREKNLNGFKFIINENNILLNLPKNINNEEVCCFENSLDYYIEKIKNKYYLFTFNDDITTIHNFYEIDSNQIVKEKKREIIDLPTWGIKLGKSISEKYIKDTTIIDERKNLYKTIKHQQIYLLDKNLRLTTLKYPDFNDRVVIRIERNISIDELNDFLDLIKLKYNYFKINDTTEYDNIFKQNIREIETFYNGYYVRIRQNTTNHMSEIDKLLGLNYNIEIMDLYELSKTQISRIGYKSKVIYSEVNKYEGDIFNPKIKSSEIIRRVLSK